MGSTTKKVTPTLLVTTTCLTGPRKNSQLSLNTMQLNLLLMRLLSTPLVPPTLLSTGEVKTTPKATTACSPSRTRVSAVHAGPSPPRLPCLPTTAFSSTVPSSNSPLRSLLIVSLPAMVAMVVTYPTPAITLRLTRRSSGLNTHMSVLTLLVITTARPITVLSAPRTSTPAAVTLTR